MAQKVAPFARGVEPGAGKGPSHDIADGDRTGKPLLRRVDAEKYAARRTARPVAQILS
jgi:hypothetical protein